MLLSLILLNSLKFILIGMRVNYRRMNLLSSGNLVFSKGYFNQIPDIKCHFVNKRKYLHQINTMVKNNITIFTIQI